MRVILDVTFNPETRHILGSALDDAWQRLEVRVHLNGSGDAIRTILAKHIIAMAEEGERDGDVPSFVEIGEAVAAIDDTTRL